MKNKLLTSVLILFFVILWRPNSVWGEIYAYVANGEEGSLSVIDTLGRSVIGTISGVAVSPVGVVASPAGNYVFVADQEDPKISVIETTNNRVHTEIDVPDHLSPQCVAVSTDGKFLYLVAGAGSGSAGVLYVVNTSSGAKVGQTNVGEDPIGVVAFSKNDDYYAYVANRASGTVSVIRNLEKLDDIDDVGGNPTGIAVSPGLDYLYVTNPDNDTVSVFAAADLESDFETKTLGDRDHIGNGPTGVAVSPMGEGRHHVYVTNQDDASVTVIAVRTDQGTHSILDSIKMEGNPVHWFGRPYGIAATPSGDYIYVTNNGNGTVSVIQTSQNLGENAVIETIDVASAPTSLGNFVGRVPPNAPIELTVTAESDQKIQLQWADDSSDALGFQIERKVEGDGDYSPLHTTAEGVESYEDTDIAEMGTYYYRIRAFNAVGDSEYVTGQAATSLNGPVKLKVTNRSTDSVSLQWEDRSGFESGFEIERRTVPKPTSYNADADDGDDTNLASAGGDGESDSFTKVATVDADTTRYTDTGLQSKTTYVYRVRAYRNGGSTSGSFILAGDETEQSEHSAYSNEIEVDTTEDYLCFIGTAGLGYRGQPYLMCVNIWRYVYLVGFLLTGSGMILYNVRKKRVSSSSSRCS